MKSGHQTEPMAIKIGLTFDLNSTKCPSQVKELMSKRVSKKS